MCDTLCAVGARGALFAKNSDRPVHEPQVTEAYARRSGGGRLRTQYLELADPGAVSLLGSRPVWLWGLEHGVSEHRVAIGNEMLWTAADPRAAPPALIGMDLVRLGLERASTADAALDVMTTLLERHGQGGAAEADPPKPYFSSFLLADPTGGWVLETSGSTWAARPIGAGDAISNRISIRTDWTRASPDLGPGTDFDRYRKPGSPTAHADRRLAVTRAAVTAGAESPGARDLVATLRHHGRGAWGRPGDDPGVVSPPPPSGLPRGEDVTVCMHVRGEQVTNASIVVELPRDAGASLRAWVAPGSPCASIYMPVFPPAGVPAALADPRTWSRFDRLRDRVESDPSALAEIRAVLGPVETELWDEADAIASGDDERDRIAFVAGVWARVDVALARLADETR
jgi:secernin